MPKFKEFNRKTVFRSKDPRATIQKGGTMSLNAAAAQLVTSSGDDIPAEFSAVFLYDEDEQIVAMRLDAKSMNKYEFRKQTGSQTWVVSSQSFMKYHKVDTSGARNYALHEYGDNIFGFSLNDPFRDVGRS